MSLGEIFAWVTAIEYAYEQAPRDMKTIVQAISLLVAGLGSAVAMSLTTVSYDPNMVIFYASLASAMGITTVLFGLIFSGRCADQISSYA
jgi:POT family proton-dependent oligopeptide transporter